MQKSALNIYVEKLWRKLGDIVKGAVVYMDNDTAECLHWNGGLQYFLQCGARAVKHFHELEQPSGYWDEVLFVLSGPILGESLETIRSILVNGQFIKCTVVTSDPNKGSPNGKLYLSIKENILDWMGSKKFDASVICLPLFVACVSPCLFVMPPFSDLFPPLETTPALLTGQNKNEVQKNYFSSTSDEIFMKALGFCLDGFLTDMNVKEDIFVWGQLSHAVGTEILKLPNFRNRRKSSSAQKASLLLLDSTLDLSPFLTHECHCMLDNVIRTLPPLPGQKCCDVAVNIAPLLYPDVKDSNRENLGLPPGCLAGPGKTSVLNHMVVSKTKECLMEINRQLVSVGNEHEIALKVAGTRITPESLLQKVQAFSSQPESILECTELLQHTLSVVECMNSPLYEKESLMLSTERLLVQNLMASQEGPTRNLLHIMAHMKERNMTLEDVVILLAHLSSVCDDTLWRKDDTKLQGALAEAIFQDLENLPPFLRNLIGDVTEESNVLSAVSQIFRFLKTIGRGKQNFKKYRSVLSQDNPALPATYRSVFQQLLLDVVDPSRPDIPDLQCISTGITDMLKSGLGLFLNVQKPHPKDNPLLIIIILGGITASEVKILRDIIATSTKASQVIFGTTKLCKPLDVLESVFKL